MDEIKQIVQISKYAGARFDLVQAGGGNSSVKTDDGQMLIKASGFLLSDLEENKGFSRVDTQKVRDIVNHRDVLLMEDKKSREALTKQLMEEATLDKENRPSIETLLHALLSKYTLHTHPLSVNIIVSQVNWKEIIDKLFDNVVIIDYKTPGIELALEMNKKVKEYSSIYGSLPKITFLQNHGLIISSDRLEEIEELTEMVLDKIENYLNVDFSHYKSISFISKIVNKFYDESIILHLCEDGVINSLLKTNKDIFFTKPFCPDKLVYCGVGILDSTGLEELPQELEEYRKRNYESPKLIIINNRLYIIANNIKKAKEIEEVFKFHLLVVQNSDLDKMSFLEFEEISYLSNWEAEKYRQKL